MRDTASTVVGLGRRANPSYPRYRYSGVEWLGEVPEHWEVKRLKYLLGVPLQYGANEPSNHINPDSPRYVRITDIREDGTLRDDTFRSIPEEIAKPYLLADGDLLFARSGATVGKTFKYRPSWGSAAYAGYLVRARLDDCQTDSDFVDYYTRSQGYMDWILGNLIQSTIQNVSAERYASLGIPLPPLAEQRAIAAFLDREMGRIDSLLAKMRLLIERLGEYRSALITRTVTRGLPAEAARAAGFSPSPRLKPAGVEWLGEVPEHWEVKRLSIIGTFFKGGGGTKEDEVEDGFPCVRYGDIYTQHQYFIRETRAHISEKSAAKYTPIQYGDILFAGSGETIEEIGKSAANLVEGPAYCGGDVIVLRPTIEADATFLGYATDCSTSTYQKAGMGRGVTVMHIYIQELAHLLLPLPPLAEQRAIAVFLDCEMERIDALVAKMRLLIERLGEYRTALITRTVTRGLPAEAGSAGGFSPSPRLKPAGVEWLGEVPEHWEVKRLGYVASYRTSSVDKKVEEHELPIRLCNYTDVYYGERIRASKGEFMEATASTSEVERFRLLVGDILVTKDSEDWRDIAVPAIVDETADDFVCGYHLGLIRSGPGIHPLFLYRALQSVVVNRQLQVSASGVTRYGLPNGAVGDVEIPLPPIDEQRAIGAFLDREMERIDALVAKMRLLIERLGEYRTALITAAVTGKIDVRGSAESPKEHLRSRLP